MSRQRMGLFSKLAAMSAAGAAAGLAWRWAQRHRGAGAAPTREVNRWEAEGGALVTGGEHVAANGVTERAMEREATAAAQSENGALPAAWPFPHSTRH